tara:strand:- start:930 stop:1136 length:207 start_codon:yes stop_codon:yes gene_type:complete
MNRIKVLSSNIDSIGYENGTLEIRFLNGSLYQYYHTSKELFENMLNAESKGKFLWRNIRDVYPFKRVA